MSSIAPAAPDLIIKSVATTLPLTVNTSLSLLSFLPIMVVPLISTRPFIDTSFANVASLSTYKVEENVDALETFKVLPIVEGPVTSNVELKVTALATFKVELRVDALDTVKVLFTVNVDFNVAALVTSKVELRVDALDTVKVLFTFKVLPIVEAPVTFNVEFTLTGPSIEKTPFCDSDHFSPLCVSIVILELPFSLVLILC